MTNSFVGLDLVASFFQCIESYTTGGTKFFPTNIAKAINEHTNDQYILSSLDLVMREKMRQPLIKYEFMDTRVAPEPGTVGGVSISWTGMAYVYKLLCHMTKGGDWDADLARDQWGDPDGDTYKSVFSRFGADLVDKKRFQRHEGSDANESPLIYLGYTVEDWNRAFVLMNYIRLQREKPWHLLATKRSHTVHQQFWAPADSTARKARRDKQQKPANQQKAEDWRRLFAKISGKSRESQSEDEVTELCRMIENKDYVMVRDKKGEKLLRDIHAWANQELDRRQWWCLLQGYRSMATRTDESKATRAAAAFLDSMVSSRKMSTPLKLPDGTISWPFADLPPSTVRTVEVSHLGSGAMGNTTPCWHAWCSSHSEMK